MQTNTYVFFLKHDFIWQSRILRKKDELDLIILKLKGIKLQKLSNIKEFEAPCLVIE